MFIITSKEHNEVIGFGETIEHPNEALARLTNERMVFVAEQVNISKVDNVPDDLTTSLYIYTDDGFEKVKLPEPNQYGIPDIYYNQIIDDYTLKLVESGVL